MKMIKNIMFANYISCHSHFNAIQVAFEKAGKPYEITTKGVFILNVLPGGETDGLLEAGDRIIKIDEVASDNQQSLVDYLGEKDIGEVITLQVEREGKIESIEVELKPIPSETSRAGLGISFAEDKQITTTPEVNIKADDIGGLQQC